MGIAVFDVDRTLLRGDSLLLAARKSNNILKLIWFSINFIPYLIAWSLKIINTKKTKEIFIDKFQICKKYNLELRQGNQEWLIHDLKKMIRKKALNRLIMHQEKGDIVILCSATPDMILEPLAKALKVDLISTNLLRTEKEWSAKIQGKNCKGNEKLKKLMEKYGSLENQILEVYGDSKGDKEILNAALIPHYRDFSDHPSEYPIFSLNKTIVIVSLVFLISLILNNFENLINAEKEWNAIWINILIGEIFILISYIIRFIRWKIMLESINLNPPILKSFYIWMGSFAFTATPGKAGEFIRVIMLNKECKLPNIQVLISLITERLTDAIAVLIILLFNLNILPINDSNNHFDFLLILIMIIGLIILIVYKKKKVKNLFILFMNKILPIQKIRLNTKNLEILRILLCPKNISISIMLGLIAWIMEGASFFIILNGFDVSISWLIATFIHTTSSLIGALTFIPGGLGPTEASSIGLLSLQGIPLSIGTSATLLIRLMTLWFATILGIICLVLNKSEVGTQLKHLPRNPRKH